MKLASYKGTRPGLQGVANILIRLRLRGPYSHNEVVFEPSDEVGYLMPDGTCEPDASGALWCVSSVAAERLPAWSARRAGKVGGVRFKRIRIDPSRWCVLDYPVDAAAAATRARSLEGALYDWQLILGYLAWLIPGKAERWTCNEFCAWLGGIADPWRFDPCALHAAVAAMNQARQVALALGAAEAALPAP